MIALCSRDFNASYWQKDGRYAHWAVALATSAAAAARPVLPLPADYLQLPPTMVENAPFAGAVAKRR